MDQFGNEQETRPVPSRRASQIFGLVLIPASLVAAYYWILVPVREAQGAAQLQYNLHGVLMAPCFLYMGIALQFVDLRDGQFRTIDETGKKTLTSTGKKFVAGLVAVLVTTMVAWYFYLRSAGFEMF